MLRAAGRNFLRSAALFAACDVAAASEDVRPALAGAAALGAATWAASKPFGQRLAPGLAAALRLILLPGWLRVTTAAAAYAGVSCVSMGVLDLPSCGEQIKSYPTNHPRPALPWLTSRSLITLAPLLRQKSTDWWFEQSLPRLGEGAAFLPQDSPAAQQAEQLRRRFLTALAEQEGSGSPLGQWVARQEAEGFGGLPHLRVYSCPGTTMNSFLVPGGCAVRSEEEVGEFSFHSQLYSCVRMMLADKGLLPHSTVAGAKGRYQAGEPAQDDSEDDDDDVTFKKRLRVLDWVDALDWDFSKDLQRHGLTWHPAASICAVLSGQAPPVLTMASFYACRLGVTLVPLTLRLQRYNREHGTV